MEIIPAILPKTFAELEEKLEFLKGVAEFVQIDITDGKFAGDASWPLGKPDKNFEAIVGQQRGLPFWEDFEFEFDLMVKNPFPLAKDLIDAGAARIIFHADSIDFENDALILDQMRTEGIVQVGIAISVDTPIEKIEESIQYADFIQCMGITHIGYQGQKFDPEVLEKIKYIKKSMPSMPVTVDGAMTPDTIPQVLELGVERVVVGSYILKSVNPIQAMRELRHLSL